MRATTRRRQAEKREKAVADEKAEQGGDLVGGLELLLLVLVLTLLAVAGALVSVLP